MIDLPSILYSKTDLVAVISLDLLEGALRQHAPTAPQEHKPGKYIDNSIT